jgi:hypothetical protein
MNEKDRQKALHESINKSQNINEVMELKAAEIEEEIIRLGNQNERRVTDA